MARDLNITMTLYPGKDISFSVPEAQAKSYFDNGDIAKPKTDALFKLAEQAFPDEFAKKRSVESANRYYQGPGKVTIKGATAPPTPTTSPKPKPPSPPTQAQIDEYARRWFKDEASGSVPYQVLTQYRLSPNQKNFRFPAGFSAVGREAVRRESARILAAQRESEAQSRERAGVMARSGLYSGGFSPLGASEGGMQTGAPLEVMTGQVFPEVSRRMTASVTGQKPSEAEPLGLYPSGKLDPGKGFIGKGKRFAAEMLTPEAMAATAYFGPAAAGLVEAFPLLGLAAGAAGMIQPISTALKGDIGGAAMEAILFGGPSAMGMRPGLQSLKTASAQRITARQSVLDTLAARAMARAEGVTPPAPTPRPSQVAPRPQGFLPTQAQVVGAEPIPMPGAPIPTALEVAQRGSVPERLNPPLVRPDIRPSGPIGAGEELVQSQVAASQTRLQELLAMKQRLDEVGLATPADILDEISRLQAAQGGPPPSVIIQPPAGVVGSRRRPAPPPEFPPVTPKRPASIGVVEPAAESVRRAELQGELTQLRAEKARLFQETGRVPSSLLEREAQIVNELRQPPPQIPKGAQPAEEIVPAQPAGASTTPETPTAPTVSPASAAASAAPEPTAVPPSTGAAPDPDATKFDFNVLQIERRIQEAMAAALGLQGEMPARGAMSNVMRRAIQQVIDNPQERESLLAEIRSTNWDDAVQVGALRTDHQAAAAFRERELLPMIEEGNSAAIKEYVQMLQAIAKVGSRKGFDLAMQRLFKYSFDLNDANAYDRGIATLTAVMSGNGATDEQILAAVNNLRPKLQSGILEFTTGKNKLNAAADAAEEVIATARASGRRVTDESVMAEYSRRLEELGKDRVPGWVGKSSPLLSPSVRLFRDGVRRLEDFRARVKDLFGDDLTDDQIDTLFKQAAAKFKQDNTKVDEIMSDLQNSIRNEAWKAQSRAKRVVKTFNALNNIEKLIVLGLDLGIFGVQFGPAKASRPGLLYAQMPSTAKRGVGERIAASTIGGVPSPRAIMSGEKGGGIVPATIKSFISPKGQAAAESDIEILGRMRYPEFDDPFGEAGLMGFRKSDLEQGSLSGELMMDSQMVLDRMPAPVRKLYGSAQRATETGLRYGRALIFDQMMSMFQGLPKEQKLEAMRSVASFVNTLTGGSTYRPEVEESVRKLGAAFTAPRYYASNLEFASGTPLLKTQLAARELPAKERAKVAYMVASEYGRMATTLLTMQMLLKPYGIEVVSNPLDKDFGTARMPVTNPLNPEEQLAGAEQTIPLVGGWAKYLPLLLSTASGLKAEREAAGVPAQYKELSVSDRAAMWTQVAYGKSTLIPRTVFSAIPAKYQDETVAFTGPGVSSFLGAEYRSPGGGAFSPKEAMKDIPFTITYLGQRLPSALFAKQILQNLPLAMGEGDSKQGKKLLMMTRFGQAMAGFTGEGMQVQLTPELTKEVLGLPEFNKLPPAEREKIRNQMLTTMRKQKAAAGGK